MTVTKICPFCGSSDTKGAYENDRFDRVNLNWNHDWCCVICESCGAASLAVLNIENAIKSWNTRFNQYQKTSIGKNIIKLKEL
jgi:hypothetical protein